MKFIVYIVDSFWLIVTAVSFLKIQYFILQSAEIGKKFCKFLLFT